MSIHIHLHATKDRVWYKASVEYLQPDYSSHWLIAVQKLGVDSEEEFKAEVRRKLKLIGATRIKFGPISKITDAKGFTQSASYKQWKQRVLAQYPHAEFEAHPIGIVAHNDGTPVGHFDASKMTGSVD